MRKHHEDDTKQYFFVRYRLQYLCLRDFKVSFLLNCSMFVVFKNEKCTEKFTFI